MQLQPKPEPDNDEHSVFGLSVSPQLVLFLAGGLVVAALFLLSGLDQTGVSAGVPAGGEFDADEVARGELLSTNHCASCHVYPQPDIVDKHTWAIEILPGHARLLGLEPVDWNSIPGGERVRTAKLLPTQPRVTHDEWRAMCAFYLASAPSTSLPQPVLPAITNALPGFRNAAPHYGRRPEISMVGFDTNSGAIYVGNRTEKTIDVMTAAKGLIGTLQLDGVPVDLHLKPEGMYVTTSGSGVASDEAKGKVIFVTRTAPDQPTAQKDLFTGLQHPQGITFADVNRDGREDIIIPERGNLLGRLVWQENMGDGTYKEHLISSLPGIVKVEARDLNKDGAPELFAMISQASEGLYLLLNRNQGDFIPTSIVEEHPAWDNSSFELADFNKDGHMDILAANGGEGGKSGYSPPALKNYHGVRVYLNDGRNAFQEAFFYPLHGASKAVARDFDGDGDLDIAAIAFSPDYSRQPTGSFVYLQNQGGAMFRAYSLPEAERGRWRCMDVADGDQDGDDDIVLGADNTEPNYVPGMIKKTWRERPVALLLLENLTKSPR